LYRPFLRETELEQQKPDIVLKATTVFPGTRCFVSHNRSDCRKLGVFRGHGVTQRLVLAPRAGGAHLCPFDVHLHAQVHGVAVGRRQSDALVGLDAVLNYTAGVLIQLFETPFLLGPHSRVRI